jgi:hypothetical protein
LKQLLPSLLSLEHEVNIEREKNTAIGKLMGKKTRSKM